MYISVLGWCAGTKCKTTCGRLYIYTSNRGMHNMYTRSLIYQRAFRVWAIERISHIKRVHSICKHFSRLSPKVCVAQEVGWRVLVAIGASSVF